MDVEQYMAELGRAARAASRRVAASTTAVRNNALLAAHDALDGARDKLAAANAEDMGRGAQSGLAAALMDRLELTPARIDAMLEGLRQVAIAVKAEGGEAAMRLRIAEDYVQQFGNLAKSANTLVVPANLSDISSMIALATSILKTDSPTAGA